MWEGELVEVGSAVGPRESGLSSSRARRRLGKSPEDRVLRAGTTVLGLLAQRSRDVRIWRLFKVR